MDGFVATTQLINNIFIGSAGSIALDCSGAFSAAPPILISNNAFSSGAAGYGETCASALAPMATYRSTRNLRRPQPATTGCRRPHLSLMPEQMSRLCLPSTWMAIPAFHPAVQPLATAPWISARMNSF